ncbi:MAG: hypothetical protein IT373_36010 [Polyangiaceae bacterium]|nr:hypothetical protein [Polyangiaceae bacterium]
MSSKKAPTPAKNDAAPPPTALAELARRARTELGPEPDLATPAATRTLAAIVRDLKGMPEVLVTREDAQRIKLARRGKVGALVIGYDTQVRYMQVEYQNFPGTDPTTVRLHRYTFDAAQGDGGQWRRLDLASDLIADVQHALLRLYPELDH